MKILLIIGLLLSTLSINAQEKIKGGYKNCNVYFYWYKSGNLDINSKNLTRQYQYDEKGNIIEAIDLSLESKIKYKYDGNDNMLESKVHNTDGSVSISKITRKYDEKGNNIEIVHSASDLDVISIDFTKIIYQYDEKGNIMEEAMYVGRSFHHKDTYKYDGKGNKIEAVHYDSDGSVISKFTYKYDEKENKIEDLYHKPDGSVSLKNTYKYDEKGNVIEMVEYDSICSHIYRYKYDEFGNIIETICYFLKGNEPMSKEDYVYTK